MPESKPMETVLETKDYQNFWVRSVPIAATLSPRVALTGCRILLIGGESDEHSAQPVSDEKWPDHRGLYNAVSR